jgi:glutaredoxin
LPELCNLPGNSQTPANTMSISQSASQIKSGDIVMYSTTECAYCTEAKSWLTQNGFAFTECNMSIDPRCQQEFNAPGTHDSPYVRGHHMKI